MRLPATLVEQLRRSDPPLLKAADADAKALLEIGQHGPVATPFDVPTSAHDLLGTKVREVVSLVAKAHRIPYEQAAKELQAARPAYLKDVVEGASLLFTALLNWRLAGSQLFFFTPALTQRLAATSASTPVDFVRLPFRSVMLVFNHASAFDAFGAAFSKPQKSFDGAISCIVTELEFENERRIVISAARAGGRGLSRQIHRSLLLRDGWTTREAIGTDWRHLQDRSGVNDKVLVERGSAFSRLVLNAILYISSQAARVSPPRRNDRTTQGDQTNYSPLLHRVVGEGMTFIGPVTNARNEGGGVAGQRSLDARHVVMGHWKSQPHGPAGSKRKVVWIEPYWRGPELAQIVERPYLVR